MGDLKTSFIVGAGASCEANLPTGEGLKRSIATMLDIKFDRQGNRISGDELIRDALALSVGSSNPTSQGIEPYIKAAWRIRNAMPQAVSIDNFIHAHQGDDKIELCGKIGIVRSILQAEKNSLLRFKTANGSSSVSFHAVENTWFNRFFQLLTENCDRNGLQ